jgi:hypothetical protein
MENCNLAIPTLSLVKNFTEIGEEPVTAEY